MKTINDIVEEIIKAEGGYVNNPHDPGGETNFGVTKKVAVEFGYLGSMKDFKIDMARAIYYSQYISEPGFDKVHLLSPQIAAELADTGVNMGPAVAIKFLQRALNGLSQNGKLYQLITVDGVLGKATINALALYMKARKEPAVEVLLKALNCLQGERYLSLSESNTKLADFTFGWLLNRVRI